MIYPAAAARNQVHAKQDLCLQVTPSNLVSDPATTNR